LLPSLCSPSPEDVDDKADNNAHVEDEAEGHDVIPSGGGEDSVDEVLVMAIFANTRASVQFSVPVTREALIIVWSGAGMAAVVTRQTGSATVGDSLIESLTGALLDTPASQGSEANMTGSAPATASLLLAVLHQRS